MIFVVVDRDKDHPVVRQQVAGHFQAGIDHIEPIGMETTVGFGIALHRVDGLVALLIEQPAALFKLRFALGKVVVIDEIVARVVGRIDVDHLHLAEVVLAQEFQHVEVVAFDVEVLGGIEVDAFGTARAQGLRGRGIGQPDGRALVGPGELVTLFGAFDHVVSQELAEFVEVDGLFDATVAVDSFGQSDTRGTTPRFVLYFYRPYPPSASSGVPWGYLYFCSVSAVGFSFRLSMMEIMS